MMIRQSLVLGSNAPSWNWQERADEEPTMNGIEAWVYALRGSYKSGRELEHADFDRHDLIILNLDPNLLAHYERILHGITSRRATLVGLYEGALDRIDEGWRLWSAVADRCDLVIGINGYGIDYLAALTSTPVRFIGIPYPVDGIRQLAVPIEIRAREVFLCGSLLKRPGDYLAARGLGLPMYGFEQTLTRRMGNVIRHRSFDKERYLRRARQVYNDPQLTVLPRTHLPGFLQRTAQSLLWMNLDPRYTWGRFVLDAAALGVPIITTQSTGHGPRLFPDLIVESPYDIRGAHDIAMHLLDDPAFYREVVEHASARMDWYRPEQTVERLMKELGSG